MDRSSIMRGRERRNESSCGIKGYLKYCYILSINSPQTFFTGVNCSNPCQNLENFSIFSSISSYSFCSFILSINLCIFTFARLSGILEKFDRPTE